MFSPRPWQIGDTSKQLIFNCLEMASSALPNLCKSIGQSISKAGKEKLPVIVPHDHYWDVKRP